MFQYSMMIEECSFITENRFLLMINLWHCCVALSSDDRQIFVFLLSILTDNLKKKFRKHFVVQIQVKVNTFLWTFWPVGIDLKNNFGFKDPS